MFLLCKVKPLKYNNTKVYSASALVVIPITLFSLVHFLELCMIYSSHHTSPYFFSGDINEDFPKGRCLMGNGLIENMKCKSKEN